MENSRIPVNLRPEDSKLVRELRAKMEQRLEKRLSIAEIIRIALRTQAAAEGILAK